MSLFLNFVFIFHTFFTFHKYCLFHYWIWAIKCRLRKSMPILRTFSYLWRYKSSRSWYSWEAILKNSRNCREITCARVPFLIKLQPATLLKKRLWHMLTKFFILVIWASFAAWGERLIFFQSIYKEIVWTQCLRLVFIVDF